jgi:hypothetical protein
MTETPRPGFGMNESKSPTPIEYFTEKYVLVQSSPQSSVIGLVRKVDLDHGVFVFDGVPIVDCARHEVVLTDNVLVPFNGGAVQTVSKELYEKACKDQGALFSYIGEWVGIGDDDFGLLEDISTTHYIFNPAVKKLPVVGYRRLDEPSHVSRQNGLTIVLVGEAYVDELVEEAERQWAHKKNEDTLSDMVLEIKLEALAKERAESLEENDEPFSLKPLSYTP